METQTNEPPAVNESNDSPSAAQSTALGPSRLLLAVARSRHCLASPRKMVPSYRANIERDVAPEQRPYTCDNNEHEAYGMKIGGCS